MHKDNKSRQRLNYPVRFKSAGWASLCLVTAIILLLYGVSLTTNLLTQLNPLNHLIYITTAMICYAIMATGFYLLWQKFSQLLTEVISGYRD